MEAGEKPYSNQLVGFALGGKPIDEYAPDFWLVSEDGNTPVGYLTSPWYSPELETNIAMGYVPYEKKDIGNKFKFHLPDEYCDTPGHTYKGYRKWLISLCESLPIDEVALVDEPTAAGIGMNVPLGSIIMIIDIGGSTIDMSVR